MGDITGTIRKVVLDGQSFDVAADANIKFNYGKYKKEAIVTSGKTMVKMTKKNEDIESLPLECTPAEMEDLKAKSEQLVDMTMAITLADNSVYRGKGHIDIDGYESESGKIATKLIPTGDWTPFLA